MKERFRVEFMEEAANFLDRLEVKTQDKVLFNIWKTRSSNDKELFKKLTGEIWEFRTLYRKIYVRFLAFWDKSDNKDNCCHLNTWIHQEDWKSTKIRN